MNNLAERLDGARYVEHNERHGLVFAWFGGHGINVYSSDGREELDFFNVGDFSKDAATLDEVKDGIRTKIEEYEEEYR